MMENKFLVVGHSIMDTRCYLKEFPKIDSMAILLKPIANSCGGSAANVSYNLARIGIKSKICSGIGNDRVGKFIKESLEREGVDTSSLRVFNKDSGRAIVIIDIEGNVKVLESIGVSDKYFKPKEKDFRGISNVHITGINKKIIQSYSKEAKKRGLFLSLDLGRGKIKEGKEKLRSVLKRADLIFLNRKELSLLLNENLEGVPDIKEKIRELGDELDLMVVVKGGSKEVVGYDGEKFYVRKPFKVKVIDTIGAGDAFDSGFLSVYSKTRNFRKSMEFALKVASLKIQRLGAQALPKTIIRRSFRKVIRS